MSFLQGFALGKITVGRVLRYSILGVFLFYSVSFVLHVRRDLGGLGVFQALGAYATIFVTSIKASPRMYESYPMVLSRALFLPPGQETTSLIGVAMFDSTTGTFPRQCTQQDVNNGAELKSAKYNKNIKYWDVDCTFFAGDVLACGESAAFRRPTCRSVRVHNTIWEAAETKKVVIAALLEPCNYLLNPKSNSNVGDPSNAASDQRGHRRSRHERMRDWAGCTGFMPKPTEIVIIVTGDDRKETLYIERLVSEGIL